MLTHRLITAADFPAVFDLYMDETANPFMFFERMPEADFQPIFAEMLRDGNRFVCELDGAVVAVYLLRRFPYRASHCAYLGGLAVSARHRGQGIASRLLHDVFEQLQASGVRRLELLVEVDNPAALALYERLGFVTEGRLRGFTKRAYEEAYVDDLLLAKYLKPHP